MVPNVPFLRPPYIGSDFKTFEGNDSVILVSTST
jgi:hypothetical protein